MRRLLLVLLLVPGAAAEHDYSHRMVVEGRVIAGDGLPVQDGVVRLEAPGDWFRHRCGGGVASHVTTTDASGDFSFCFHEHELPPGLVVNLTSGEAFASRVADDKLRRTVVLLRDDAGSGTAPPAWDSTFRVEGRVWSPGPTTVEGVRVAGDVLARQNVTVALAASDGRNSTFAWRTDAFGDYGAFVRLKPDQRPEDVTMSVSVAGVTRETPMFSPWHRVTLDVVVPGAGARGGDVVDADAGPPGTRAPELSVSLVMLVAGALVVAIVVAKRRRS